MPDANPADGVRRIERLLALAVLVSAAYFVDYEQGVNANAHMDQCYSIVSSGDLSIDEFVYRKGQPAFAGMTVDYSRGIDGHAYSNKAPGLSFLALPIYAPLYWVETAVGIDPRKGIVYAANLTIANIFTNGVLGAAGAVGMLRAVLTFGLPLWASVYGAVAVVAGTMYLPYASAFYSHTAAAGLVAIALWLAVAGARTPGGAPRRAAALGAVLGAAVLVDYTAVFAAVTLPVYYALRSRRAGEVALLALGALPFLAVFLIHNHVVYGSPLSTAYATINPEHLSPSGSNFEAPTLERFWQLLGGTRRGLFFFSPPLMLAIPGAWRLGKAWLPETAAAALAFGAALVFNASLYGWDGGSTAGPRYMITALPVLAPLVAAGVAAFPRAGAILLAYALVNHLGALAVDYMCPRDVDVPLLRFIYPALVGITGPRRDSLAMVFGLTRYQAWVPIFAFWTVIGVLLDRAARGSGEERAPDAAARGG